MKKPCILLIEDDSINAFIVKKFLQEEFCVIHANSRALAVSLYKEYKIDLLLMDINLGHEMMGGVEALRELRTIEREMPIPAIALTAYAGLGDRERFIAEGFNDYISKPFDKRRLIRNINELINHSESV